MTDEAKCPIPHEARTATNSRGTSTNKWWPDQLNTDALIHNSEKSSPYQDSWEYNYTSAFKKLDLNEVKAEITKVMKTSHPMWPADYGHYGPLFIRMAWHSAGTYRVSDGRGGAGQGLQRFAPLNSWPDNVNLDKARRLLWPVKQKYGKKLSWADLMILAGNVALEDMGFKTFGFAGGRADVWEPDNTYWGSETEWLANGRYDATRDAGTLENPLAAVQMGLIYVNPEGPDGNPDFKLAAADIRETFKRMAMNDEETVALIAGGHAFGKTHGAGSADQVGKEPEGAEIHQAGLGWANSQGKGHSEDTISSGLEVTWTPTPTKWDNSYLEMIYGYDKWELEESPAGSKQWKPVADEVHLAPHAHLENKHVEIRMLTTDLALRYGDEEYDRISRKFLEDFDYFSEVFARAWFKLTHRDMGPKSRYVGPEVPSEDLIWQDPISGPKITGLTNTQHYLLKGELLKAINADPSLATKLIRTAWTSASTYRDTDKRGGSNGARLLLEPQISWDSSNSNEIFNAVSLLTGIANGVDVQVSTADLIVIGADVAIERAASLAGVSDAEISRDTWRSDAIQDDIDVESFNYLKPIADGFINWAPGYEDISERLLVEKAALLGLTPPEMTVLIGGLRVLGVTHGDSKHGVLTERPGILTNDYFRNLLDINIAWAPRAGEKGVYGSHSYFNGERKWTATRTDLVFASNSVLRSLAEVYASDDALEKFVYDFTYAWSTVMNAGRF